MTLSVNREVVYGLVRTGEIACVRVGPRLFRIRPEELDAFMLRNTVQPDDDVMSAALAEETA